MANIATSVCTECQALSPGMPIIILPSKMKGGMNNMHKRNISNIWFKNFENSLLKIIKYSCTELQALSLDMQIIILLLIIQLQAFIVELQTDELHFLKFTSHTNSNGPYPMVA